MTATEAAQQWLKRFPKLSPNKVLEEFIPLLGEAWETKKELFAASDLEDSITNTLAAYMAQRVRQATNISWSVRPQISLLTERSDGTGVVIGRCDLVIDLGGNREYIQECKRLWPEGKNATFTKSARLYVQEGLLRFLHPSEKHPTVHAQYDCWQGFAGMIGYVMDGRTSEACEAVRGAVATHASPRSLADSCPACCPANSSICFFSTHQDCVGKTVRAHHLFLGFAIGEQANFASQAPT